MKTLAILIAIGLVSVGSCLADISSVNGTGTTATLLLPSTQSTLMDGYLFPTAVIGDALSGLSSQIAFTYTPPPDYSMPGDRLIIEVLNDTGSTLSGIDFTLLGSSAPQYYDAPYGSNPPYQGVPSAGVYSPTPNTYTTTADLSPPGRSRTFISRSIMSELLPISRSRKWPRPFLSPVSMKSWR
jgi:hypothetical protein